MIRPLQDFFAEVVYKLHSQPTLSKMWKTGVNTQRNEIKILQKEKDIIYISQVHLRTYWDIIL